jgi:hypothetical protein
MEHSYDGAEAGIFAGVIIDLFYRIFLDLHLNLGHFYCVDVEGLSKRLVNLDGRHLFLFTILVVMIEIVGKPMIWLLWCLLPCVNWIFGIWVTTLISKSYGKDEGFTVGLILLPIVFWPILGFGNAKYLGPSAAEAQNPF